MDTREDEYSGKVLKNAGFHLTRTTIVSEAHLAQRHLLCALCLDFPGAYSLPSTGFCCGIGSSRFIEQTALPAVSWEL